MLSAKKGMKDMERKNARPTIPELLRMASEKAKRNGTAGMTLDEINAEIDAARKEMQSREIAQVKLSEYALA